MSTQTIGWTLIHSLWEGLAIYVILRIAGQFTNRADVRYGLGVAALGSLAICSIVTWFILDQRSPTGGFQFVLNAGQSTTSAGSWSVFDFINENIIWFIRFWALGFAVGLIRIAAGLWYIGRLRHNSNPVQDEWMDVVKRLSESLNINRVVLMAEARISSPMVVGFMKPIILFPVGLLSGLSTEQVETILVHELSHIRRQDYIINLAQSVIETIFFFNPFALLMSSMIREERENCCDDIVIAKGISPISYVKTLAQLEAVRSSSTLALGFAGNQNQLLNRIKRIMENSAKNDWGKGRFVPVALLFLGLVCASWLSISSEKEGQISHNIVANDTSREDGLVVIKKGRKHDGRVMEEPAETIAPSEEGPGIESVPHFDEIPPVPDLDTDMNFHMAPDFDFPPIPFDFNQFADWDSVPGYTFRLRDTEGNEEFEKEFTMKFRENFKEFYEKNKDQFDRMMKEVRDSERRKTEANRHREAAEVVDLADMKRMTEFGQIMSIDMVQALKRAEGMTETLSSDEAMQALQEMKMSSDMLSLQKSQMDVMNNQLREQTIMLEDMARKTGEYKKALTEMLADDGYIKKGDSMGNLNINDNNGEMTINGHKIKEKDAVKYRALHDSFFPVKPRMSYDRYGRNE